MTVSRRKFLTSSSIGLGAFSLSNVQAKEPVPDKWDKTSDVVVVGLGGAGASAAVEAFDNGAKVLILEKQAKDHLYNNTRMSGGGFHCPDKDGDPKALKEYAKAMFSGENIPWKSEGEQAEVSDGLAQGWADYSPLNAEFLKMCDPEFHPLPRKANGAAFKNFPGAIESHYRAYSSSYSNKVNRYNAKDKPKAEKSRGEAFWNALYNGVLTRNIEVLYETPAQKLITDDDGAVIGIIAVNGEKKIRIKANKAVILCSGGFEYNKAMRKAFLEGPGETGWAFYGSPDNTGDGIIMGLAVGAGLQKVGKAAARMIMAVPVMHHGLKMGLDTPVVGSKNSILVDNYGNRFCSETKVIEDPSRYMFYKEAVHMNIDDLTYPRLPAWFICDDQLLGKRTLTDLGHSTAGFGFVPWTKDNQDAIKRGWILEASSIEELADKIKAQPDNKDRMVKENLVTTIAKFNDSCEKGSDEEFHRRANTLGPINQGKFYAVPLVAGGPNTKGGLAANGNREVLDWFGTPIPRLYAAGESASALKFVYQGGGNLTECIVYGRIAGKNAANLNNWS